MILAKVIEQIPKDVLYDFLCFYTHIDSFIHSCVPLVASGKAERSGAENEPRDIHPLPNHPLYGVS